MYTRTCAPSKFSFFLQSILFHFIRSYLILFLTRLYVLYTRHDVLLQTLQGNVDILLASATTGKYWLTDNALLGVPNRNHYSLSAFFRLDIFFITFLTFLFYCVIIMSNVGNLLYAEVDSHWKVSHFFKTMEKLLSLEGKIIKLPCYLDWLALSVM